MTSRFAFAAQPLSRVSRALLPVLLGLWLVAGTAAAQDLAVLPTIGLLWQEGNLPATAELFLAPDMRAIPEVIAIHSTDPDIEVVDFKLYPASEQLILRLKLVHGRAADIDRVVVEYRSQPSHVMALGVLRVVPADTGVFAVRWARMNAAADIGMVFVGALVNDSADLARVRALTYAPDAIGQGSVLVRVAPLDAYEAWSDQVMVATAEARWPREDLDAVPRPFSPDQPPQPPTPKAAATAEAYRAVLSDRLPDSRWADASQVNIDIPPGQALFVAITVASFRYDIARLALDIAPVATVETTAGCCLQIGAGSASVTRGDLPF